jgi:hypothetical protein
MTEPCSPRTDALQHPPIKGTTAKSRLRRSKDVSPYSHKSEDDAEFIPAVNNFTNKGELMKIVIKEGICRFDDTPSERLIIDGKQRVRVSSLSECPEDAIIGRRLVSCVSIAAYMKEAYEVGKRGEDLEIVREPDDEED